MSRVAKVVAALAVVAGIGVTSCDTGDGKSLAPPPPTTAPVPTAPTVAPTAEVTFLDGFGTLSMTAAEGAASGRELGIAVTQCRWEPERTGSEDIPVLSVAGNGVTPEGERFAVTLEGFRAADGPLRGRVDLSHTGGALWEARQPGGGRAVLDVDEQALGIVVRAELEVTEIRPGGARTFLGPAVIDITCL